MSLSDKERDILAGLEAQLAEDPKFVSSMTKSKGFHIGSTKNIIIGVLVILAGITALLAGITTHLVILGATGFLAMIGGATLIFSGGRSSEIGSSQNSEKPKSAFMQNLETKWEERRNSQP